MNKFLLWIGLMCLPMGVFGQTNYLPYAFTTLAGSVTNIGSSNGIGTGALFNSPHGMAVDKQGNIYVTEITNNLIRKITPAGVVSTLAGLAGASGTNDGVGSAARFNSPYAVTVDDAGIVYVADTFNHTIRKITAAGAVSTLAGLGGVSGTNDGTGSAARFDHPFGLVPDKSGNIYVVDDKNQTIRKIAPGAVVTTIAGSAGHSGSSDGTNSVAMFKFPSAIVMNSSGVLFVADEYNHTIRRVTTNGVVSTFAGSAGNHGLVDATGTAARFYNPNGLAIDAADNLYVSEYLNDTIRQITPAALVTTLAGWPQSIGSSNGIGSSVLFNNPRQDAVDSLGNIYVADFANQLIRKGWPVGATPVIQLNSPALTNGLMQLDFTLLTGSAASFQLLQAHQLVGLWMTNFSALLTTKVSGVSYHFSAPTNAPAQFYRVQTP